jgi:dimeric dUTPase (all-alpha-NTP-PPase superfamily)
MGPEERILVLAKRKTIMNIDVEKIIAEQLPSAVGDVLRKRLAQLTDYKAQIKKMNESLDIAHNVMKKQNTEISDLKKDVETLAGYRLLESKLKAKDIELNIKEQVLKVQLDCAEARVKDTKDIVSLVFQNNRFKYSENWSTTTPSGQYQSTSKMVDGQG